MTLPELSTYADAIDYLFTFVNWEVERHVRYAPEVMALDRPRALLSALGNPHLRFPAIHITGTKGKGSVGAMCAAALQTSGLRTGLYSSPHLQDYRERFRIDNILISPEEFTRLVNVLRRVIEDIPGITWFEVTTALAFLFFAEHDVDVAVIEVGLGGRLDATNVVSPLVSVITSLSYDHTYLLGDSLASIAREKGGIIKPGTPVVSAPQPAEALDVLAAIADEQRAPLILIGRDWVFEPQVSGRDGEHFLAGPAGKLLEPYQTSLIGHHQVLNATTALVALDQVRRAGLAVTNEGVRGGLARVDWPGRLEVIPHTPMILLDAAHNAASAAHLRAALAERFTRRPLALVFGASADKDVTGMFNELLPLVDVLVATQSAHPRAMSSEAIEQKARACGYSGSVYQTADVSAALRLAAEHVSAQGLICVTGSLFVVGDVRSVFSLPIGHVVSAVYTPEISSAMGR